MVNTNEPGIAERWGERESVYTGESRTCNCILRPYAAIERLSAKSKKWYHNGVRTLIPEQLFQGLLIAPQDKAWYPRTNGHSHNPWMTSGHPRTE